MMRFVPPVMENDYHEICAGTFDSSDGKTIIMRFVPEHLIPVM
jgi:hypothetical protein